MPAAGGEKPLKFALVKNHLPITGRWAEDFLRGEVPPPQYCMGHHAPWSVDNCDAPWLGFGGIVRLRGSQGGRRVRRSGLSGDCMRHVQSAYRRTLEGNEMGQFQGERQSGTRDCQGFPVTALNRQFAVPCDASVSWGNLLSTKECLPW
jgi:hypothetical protein